MREAQLESFVSTDGFSVKVNKLVFGKIVDEDAAYKWLAESGNSAIIKKEVKCEFNRDNLEQQQLLMDYLRSHDLNPVLKSSIHHKTLGKFLGDCDEEGIDVPESIKVTKINQAKIKYNGV